MEKIQDYYDKTEKFEPHPNVKKFINRKTDVGKAVDLGCGSGRDSVYLIKNGWNITAIDREDVEERIVKKLNKEELTKFKFEKQEFENLKLEKNNLVVANNSLSFCNKNNFFEMWEKIKNSILSNRIFYWGFFWY